MDKKIIKQTARAYYNLLPFMQKTEKAFAKFEAIFGNGAVSYINNVWHEASKEQPNTEKPYLAVVELPGKKPIYAIWKGYANHPFWTKWAYIEDLIPDEKGGER